MYVQYVGSALTDQSNERYSTTESLSADSAFSAVQTGSAVSTKPDQTLRHVLRNIMCMIMHILCMYLCIILCKIMCMIMYRIAGIFRGAKFSGKSKFRLFRGKIFMVARYKPHPIATTRRFVGNYFMVRFSTTKTTKILPLENYPLYGIYYVCI